MRVIGCLNCFGLHRISSYLPYIYSLASRTVQACIANTDKLYQCTHGQYEFRYKLMQVNEHVCF